MILPFKGGRLPRAHNPAVPHLSAWLAGKPQLPPPPLSVDYTKGLPYDLGEFKNDELGDCTCAAFYHARQVWSYNAGGIECTDPDLDVLKLYEEACNYNPNDPSTDQGGVEQDVLTYLVNTGAPVGDGTQRDQLLGFVEVDPRALDDMKRVISDCGVAYIGINVPQYLVAQEPPDVWDYQGEDTAIAGGHAVVLAGYDFTGPDTFTAISWGRTYKLTRNFVGMFVEEAYALADKGWFNATGKTPAGMDLAYLQGQMTGLKVAA